LARLDTIPGIARRTAEVIAAERSAAVSTLSGRRVQGRRGTLIRGAAAGSSATPGADAEGIRDTGPGLRARPSTHRLSLGSDSQSLAPGRPIRYVNAAAPPSPDRL